MYLDLITEMEIKIFLLINLLAIKISLRKFNLYQA